VRLTFATPATYLKIPEIRVTGTLAAAPGAAAPVEASVATRCVAGKVTVVASVTNTDAAPLAIGITSPFGSKSFATVAPGKTVSAAFSTRLAQSAAGSLEVTATGSGAPATTRVAYAAKSCG